MADNIITSKVDFPDEWTLRSETALLCAELIQKDYKFSEYVEVDGIKPYENKMENGASCVFEDLVTEWRASEKGWIRRKDLEPESFKYTSPTTCMQILAFENPNLNEEDKSKEIARWKRNKQFIKYRERTGTSNDNYFFELRGPIKEPLIYTCIVWNCHINGTNSITDYVKSQLFKVGVNSKESYERFTNSDRTLVENDFFPATPIIKLEFLFVPGCEEADKKKIVATFCGNGKCNISIINLFDMAYSLSSPDVYNKLPDLRKQCFGFETISLPTNSMDKLDPSKKSYKLKSAYKDPQLNFLKHDGHMPDYSSIYTRAPRFIEQYDQDDRRVWFVEEFSGRNDLDGHHFKYEKYERQRHTYDPIVKAGYIGIDAVDPYYEDATNAPATLGQWLSVEDKHCRYKFDPENICSLYLLRDVIKIGDIVVIGNLNSTSGICYGEVTGDYEYLDSEIFKTPENMKKKVGIKFKNVRHVRKVKWIGSIHTIESGISDVNQIFHEKVSSSIKELPDITDELQKSIMDGNCTYYMAVHTLDSIKIRFVSNENLRRSILGLRDYGGREYIGVKDSYVTFNKGHTSSVLNDFINDYLISYDSLHDKYREDIPLKTFCLPSSDRVLCKNTGIRNGLNDFDTWNKAFDDNNAAIFDWQDFIKRSREDKAIKKQSK